MQKKSPCLVVENDAKRNLDIQQVMQEMNLQPYQCEGLFSCSHCTFEPDLVVLGKSASFPDTSQIGNVEVMIRETHVPVLIPADIPKSKRTRFHNYHIYEDLNETRHLIKEVIQRHQKRRQIRDENTRFASAIAFMDCGNLSFKTLSEAQALSKLFGTMGNTYNGKIGLGLCELFINAIEHGNLGVSQSEKLSLRREGRWLQEIETRLLKPEFADKKVTVFVEKKTDLINLTIVDEGRGFDWKSMLKETHELNSDKDTTLGLRLIMAVGFEKLLFKGSGNEVHCSFRV